MNSNQCLSLKDIAFTDELTDALREAGALMCRHYEGDPAVYVCDGYGFFLVKLDEREYDALVRPVTDRDPGNFITEYDGECPFPLLDLRKILEDFAFNASYELTAMPRTIYWGSDSAKEVSTFYSAEGDFVSCLNARYASIAASGLTFRAMDGMHAVVCYRPAASASQDDPCAAILPIRMREDDSPVRETRAWFKQGGGQEVGCS